MILTKQIDPVSNKVIATVDRLGVDYWLTIAEQDAIRKSGPLAVELGGTIPPDDFTVTSRQALFPTQLPFVQEFDGAGASTKADQWLDEIVTRITTALTAAVTASDTNPASIEVVTVNTAA